MPTDGKSRVPDCIEPVVFRRIVLVLLSGKAHDTADIRALVDSIRDAAPDETFWKGVSGIAESHGGVTITFHARTDPRLVAVANREVACLLYPSTK